MADDEFDIDIYGDTTEDVKKDEEGDVQIDTAEVPEADEGDVQDPEPMAETTNGTKTEEPDDYVDIKTEHQHPEEIAQKIKSTDDSGPSGPSIPKQAPQQQGVKRKEGSDDRPIDPGATTALSISELHWWNTDDDIRGWVNQAECEDELKEITFSEHKVNGKSKGQAYVEFTTQQAATAAKHKIESFGEGQQYVKKHVVTYSNPNINPFKTLPKDVPARADKSGSGNRSSGPYNSNQSSGGPGNFGGNNFRGRTPGYNSNRGAMNNVGGGFNRNFSSPAMGGMTGGGGFQGGMGGFPNGNMNNNFNRGGMMNGMRGGFNNMRGGRGGMGNGMMNMPGMGMNGMGGMANGMMNMPMMGAMGGMQGKENFTPNHSQHQPAAFPSPVYGNSIPQGQEQTARQPYGPTTVNNTFAGCTKEQPWGGYSNQKNGSTVPPAVPAFSSATPSPVNHSTFHSAPASFPNNLPPQRPPYQVGPQRPFGQFVNHYTPHQQGGGGEEHLAKQNPNTGAGFPANGMPGMPHFNPAFFQQNQAAGGAGGGDQWQNPHGQKRARPE